MAQANVQFQLFGIVLGLAIYNQVGLGAAHQTLALVQKWWLIVAEMGMTKW